MSEVQRVAPLRRDVVAFAAEYGMEERLLPDLALAVSEVLTNMVVHDGSNGSAAEVRLTVEVGDEDVVVRVRGSGLVPPRFDNPVARQGMVIVATLARSLRVDARDGGGTEISMVFNRLNA